MPGHEPCHKFERGAQSIRHVGNLPLGRHSRTLAQVREQTVRFAGPRCDGQLLLYFRMRACHSLTRANSDSSS